jgi:hypothetical protein
MSSRPQLYSPSGGEIAAAQAAISDAGVALTGADAPQPVAATTMQVNYGKDTLITLVDGSTILLKGVARIDGMFFA